MVTVIINADDLGISHKVNEEIADALSKGYITSASILANSQYWDEIHEIFESHPDASFGIHLNLTEGKALTENATFKSLGVVDAENKFTKNIRHLDMSDMGLKMAVYEEWDAQLYKVICIEGIPVTHIDGHHHIHTEYEFNDILIRLLNKYAISRVRNRYSYPLVGVKKLMKKIIDKFASAYLYECFGVMSKKRSSKEKKIAYHMENYIWRNNVGKVAKLSTYFDSYKHFTYLMKTGIIVEDGSVIELMCHPGHDDYAEEYLMIKSQKIQEVMPEIALMSYGKF